MGRERPPARRVITPERQPKIWLDDIKEDMAIHKLNTGTAETLDHHPRAAVHRNAAISDFVRAFDHVLLP